MQFKCEKCNKEVEARRVWARKKLPKILVVTIKRFEMDYNTFEWQKKNSRFEYPQELDVKVSSSLLPLLMAPLVLHERQGRGLRRWGLRLRSCRSTRPFREET